MSGFWGMSFQLLCNILHKVMVEKQSVDWIINFVAFVVDWYGICPAFCAIAEPQLDPAEANCVGKAIGDCFDTLC